MDRKKKQPLAPVELEVMPVHDTLMKRFIVTAYSSRPEDPSKEEPDIRLETDACNGSAASMEMMRQFRRPSYFYMTITDITPARKRKSHHVEEAEDSTAEDEEN